MLKVPSSSKTPPMTTARHESWRCFYEVRETPRGPDPLQVANVQSRRSHMKQFLGEVPAKIKTAQKCMNVLFSAYSTRKPRDHGINFFASDHYKKFGRTHLPSCLR